MIRFQEITNSTGISYSGPSYGASWGDFNGDIYPDLYVSNHGTPGILYLNQGDGTFTDVTAEIFLQDLKGDAHGAAWSDFDNDGDQDLIQLVGGGRGVGTGANQMYVNGGGKLEDRASELGIDYPLSRGRTPLWLDFDNDGWLDLFAGAASRPDGQAPPTIFRQTADGFEDSSSTVGFDLSQAFFGFLSDLSGDRNLDVVFKLGFLAVYDFTSIPFEKITTTFKSPPINARDIVSGDFNGDLRPDLYLTRSGIASDLVQEDSNTAKAKIVSQSDRKGIKFDSTGTITFDFNLNSLPSLYPDIYIGAGGFNPNGLNFTLSSDNPDVQGIFPHTPGVDRGIYIGYDSELQHWQILVSSPDKVELLALIETNEPISDLTAIGFNPNLLGEDQLLINTEQGLIDKSQESGINSIPVAGNSVVSGDFDNDMDLDLYMVATGPAGNRSNILYENQGDGTFIAVSDAGGATGTRLGVGDSVVTADYDFDGFLDLFITNGQSLRPLNQDGAYQLFHNQGNDNHWLQIDLEGVKSNRDGIGAQVFVTTGGVTQLREQNGGMHRSSQNHQRLHFGLADNTKVDEILIKWPSGKEQKIQNIPANQLLHIIEPSELFTPGKPAYMVGSESGVFVWKETFDGAYQLRTVGSQNSTQFLINLISTKELQDITPFSLETHDQLEESEFGFSLDSKLFSGQDGLDFHLAPGAKALFSVTQDGVANPRQLHFGNEGTPLSPTGWILDSGELPARTAFNGGKDLGLFVGTGATSDVLEFRWTGDRNLHRANLTAIADTSTATFVPFGIDQGGGGKDIVTPLNNGVKIEGNVGSGIDGLDVNLTEPVKIGFSYQQDDLFQPHYVNPLGESLGLPNAYELPLAEPYNQPQYNAAQDKGLFLWQDRESGMWELRATAGGDRANYVGSIFANLAAESVEGVKLEPNDVLDTTNVLQIDFNLKVVGSGQDGVRFKFPDEANLTFYLEGGSEPLRIGSNQWRVSKVPLDLSGW
ncbi:MAG: CRTAC1 family protein [Xenococcaceae cyanobacterium MO_188.B19]|nr:CRTAC1 family protein [Xenococcaceae cyanobacterium MO_188.B19]